MSGLDRISLMIRPHISLKAISIVSVVYFLFFIPSSALASSYAGESIAIIMDSYESIFTGSDMYGKLLVYAQRLFLLLAVIQFFWAFGVEFMRGEASLQSFLALVVREFLMVGFFWWIMGRMPELSNNLLNYFRIIASSVSSASSDVMLLAPDMLFQKGIDLFNRLFFTALDASMLAGLSVLLPSLIILVAFSFTTLAYVMSLVQFYFLCGTSVLFLGLAGCRFTSPPAIRFLWAITAVCAKIFVITILTGVIDTMSAEWILTLKNITDAEKVSFTSLAAQYAGASIIFFGLVRELPQYIAGLIDSSAGGMGAGAAIAAATVAGGIAGGAVTALPRGWQGAKNLGSGYASVGRDIARGVSAVTGAARNAFHSISGGGGTAERTMGAGNNSGPLFKPPPKS